MVMFHLKLKSFRWLALIFLLSIVLSTIYIGHVISIRSYFHGTLPVDSLAQGETSMLVAETVSLIACSTAAFILLTEMKSGTIIVLVNLLFATSFIADIVAIYMFRDPRLDLGRVTEHAVRYYSQHKAPPPFIVKVQWELDGYCCGPSGFRDYMGNETQFFNVPHSCCFSRYRSSTGCTSHLYRPLYEFHESYANTTLKNLQTSYRDLHGLPTAQKRLLPSSQVHAFARDNADRLFTNLEAELKSNMSSKELERLQEQFSKQRAGSAVVDSNTRLNQLIFERTRAKVQEELDRAKDPSKLAFFPVGCWHLIEEIRQSTWPGFNPYRKLAAMVHRASSGILATAVLRLIVLVVCVLAFNGFVYSTWTFSSLRSQQLWVKSKKLLKKAKRTPLGKLRLRRKHRQDWRKNQGRQAILEQCIAQAENESDEGVTGDVIQAKSQKAVLTASDALEPSPDGQSKKHLGPQKSWARSKFLGQDTEEDSDLTHSPEIDNRRPQKVCERKAMR